jgi:hypothetical protein
MCGGPLMTRELISCCGSNGDAATRSILRFYAILMCPLVWLTEMEVEAWMIRCLILESYVCRGLFYSL